ncbi:MAG TPA: sulfatase-like hydrolase/transferase [Pirellulaceae bacterium]|nr:sulfatase-like hydrolase/transferase [Pirellulaceae bacterium]
MSHAVKFLAFLWLAVIYVSGGELRAAEPPNVLFIFSDDQRFDTIHALGNDQIETPNLDALVNRGMTFTHTYIMGSTQGAVCVCSRACLLSGRSLYRAPANLQGVPLLPKQLERAGVNTFGIGKWHNGAASFNSAFEAGDAIFFGGMNNHSRIPVQPFDPAGKYPKRAELITDQFSTELFADKAVAFLKNYQDAKPFFLYLSLTAPHDPRTPPGKFKTMYDPEKLSLPKSFMPQHPFNNGELTIRDEQLAPWPRTTSEVKQQLADYYGMISHLDEQVGRVLQALEDSGKAKNTIIVFVGDNGLAVGKHGLLGKQSLYDHSVRVPLIVAGPGITAAQRSDALVYLFDLFPTICELTDAKIPDGVEGVSLLPLLRGETAKGRDEIFAAYRDGQRMVRDKRYKLIRYPQINRSQLFDLQDDPEELNDLSAETTQAARVSGMLDRLAKLQTIYGDKLPLTSAKPEPAEVKLPLKGKK